MRRLEFRNTVLSSIIPRHNDSQTSVVRFRFQSRLRAVTGMDWHGILGSYRAHSQTPLAFILNFVPF